MALICISRGSYGYGKELAEQLAEKLGYACLGREEVVDEAADFGIPIGKIEAMIVKRYPLTESLSLCVDQFKAFVTEKICDLALKGGLVYHGRASHLVLQGVPNILRIRAITNQENRLKMVINRLNISRDKAKTFIDRVDEDRELWVRTLYNINWQNPSHYDLTINVDNLTINNSATALVSFSTLPEFQETPASRRILEDFALAAKCRLFLGKDKRTSNMKLVVSAARGEVTVNYQPYQAEEAKHIPHVLEKVSEIKNLHWTPASANILYIQEECTESDANLKSLLELAGKWQAAIDLVHFTPGESHTEDGNSQLDATKYSSETMTTAQELGGILDDDEADKSASTDKVMKTYHSLVQHDCGGAIFEVRGDESSLISILPRNIQYSLIVIGNVFVSSGESLKKRLKRDFAGFLTDQLRIPVIEEEELGEKYLYTPKQWLRLAMQSIITFLIYFLLFKFQVPILSFISSGNTAHHLLAAILIVVCIPFAAMTIGGVSQNLLKFIKLE